MIDKYKNKAVYFIVAILAVQLLYISCKEEEELTYITLVGNKTLDLGQSSQFSALIDATNAATSSASVKWESSNPEVAIIDQNGLVQSLTVGTTVVLAALPNGKQAAVEVTVSQPASIGIPKSIFYFVSDGYGSDTTITATLKPEQLSSALKIEWKSSDPEVVEIVKIDTLETMRKEMKSYAVFRPKKKGTALITVSNGEKRREFTINVGTVVTKIGWLLSNGQPSTPSKTFTFNLGADTLLTGYYDFLSSDAANGWKELDFQWSVEAGKENILEIVEEPTVIMGMSYIKIHAKSEGKAKIMLNVVGMNLMATCHVRDIAKIKVDSVKLTQTIARQKAGGAMLLLGAAAYPQGVVSAWPIVWSSSDPAIATVNNNGEVITKDKAGRVTITAKSGDKSASCEVTVFHMVDKVFINSTSSTTVMIGNQETWTTTCSPAYAELANIKWRSSNESVARVDDRGQVTAIGIGKASITVSGMTETETTAMKEVTSEPRTITVVPLQESAILTEADWLDMDNYCTFNSTTREFTFMINYEAAGYELTSKLADGVEYTDGTYTIGKELKDATLTWFTDNVTVGAKVTRGTVTLTKQNGKIKLELDLMMEVGDKQLTVKGVTPYF